MAMADDDNTNQRGQWRRNSANLFMRADDTEAGKLVRLADVVLWLIEARELPRMVAVTQLCDALESASPAPALFLTFDGAYAAPADDKLFGYHTADSWAEAQANIEAAHLRQHQSAREYASDEWRSRDRWNQPGRQSSASEPPPPQFVSPGIPAVLRLIREYWAPTRWRNGLGDVDAFAHDGLRGCAIAVRVADAGRIWGWGGTQTAVADAEQWTGERLAAEKARLVAAGKRDHTQQLVTMTGLTERDIRRRIAAHVDAAKPSPLPSVRVVSGKRRA